MAYTGEYSRWVEDGFRSLYRPLTYFAFQYLRDAGRAEDVVQGVFTKMLDSPVAVQSQAHLKHYLYKAVRNACLNELSGSSLHSRLLAGMSEDAPEYDDDLFHNIVRTEIYSRIMDAVETLPRECAKVFWMSHIDQMSNREIADALSISVNTVKVQKNRARMRLQKILKDIYPLIGWIMA